MTLLRKNRWAEILFLVSTVLTLAGQEPRSPLLERGKRPETSPAAGAKKPNIVLMLTDNLGCGELGIYGGILRGAPTPRIDKLASEGCPSPKLDLASFAPRETLHSQFRSRIRGLSQRSIGMEWC